MRKRRPISRKLILSLLVPVLGSLHACRTPVPQTFLSPASNLSTPQGTPVTRAIQVGFINNTPFRAICTFGGYDPLDQETLPLGFGQLRLEGNTASAQIIQPCRKVFSVGGAELIRLIKANRNNPAIEASLNDPLALVDGVNFSSAPPNDPLAAEPTEGKAAPRLELNGAGFSCARTNPQQATGTGLLIFTFEQDVSAPGGFRIDYEFVQP